MSGAEVLIVLGLASNVVQFIDFGSKLVSRIKEYASSAVEAPKKITALAERLDLVLKTLNALNATGRSTVDHEAKAIQSCISEAEEFDALLDKFKVKTRAVLDGEERPSWIDKRRASAEKTWKAFKSLRGEEKIEEFQASLDRVLSLVSLQLQTRTASTSAKLEDNTGIIMQNSEQTLNILNDLQMWMKSLNLDHQVQPEKSKPIILIPYSRNRQFVIRGRIFEEIDDKIFRNQNQQHAALCGLGGVGKSQIALEYAYKVKERLPEYSIFWVHASNAARFEEAYKRIADECDIQGRENPKEDLMQLVRNWLETKSKMSWLMIVDNVDDAKVFFRKTHYGKSLSDYVPETLKGHVLYTTRSRDIGWDLTGDPISVPSMTPEEAGTLLDKKTGQNIAEEEKTQLLNELDNLPLAITQAAAFMAKRRKTVSQYLTLYRHSDSAKIRLLSHEFVDHGTDMRRMESVATTWIISFEYIRNENQRAAEILCLMSFLDRQGILESLIGSEDEDPVAFADALGILEAFSLVVVNEKGDSYDMHRLVQVATRTWLSKYDKGEEMRWASRALSLLSGQFSYHRYSDLKLSTAYLPHAEAVLDIVLDDEVENDLLNRATLLCETAIYLENIARYEAAKNRAQESLQIREKFLGAEHLDTLKSMSVLAFILVGLGNYEGAGERNRRALEGYEKVLGPEHPETLTIASNMALVLCRLGKYEAAEEMNRRVLEGYEKALGPEHPHTLTSVNNLGLVLYEQGKYEAAEEMNRRALGMREKVLGPEHPDIMMSVNNLASVLHTQGKFEEAEEMNRRALEGYERVQGLEHPDTLLSVNNLASVLYNQGKFEAAEEMKRRALGVRERVLGPEHPHTLNSVYGLACILQYQRQYDESLTLYLKALAGYKKILGPGHPNTLECSQGYTSLLKEMKKTKWDDCV